MFNERKRYYVAPDRYNTFCKRAPSLYEEKPIGKDGVEDKII